MPDWEEVRSGAVWSGVTTDMEDTVAARPVPGTDPGNGYAVTFRGFGSTYGAIVGVEADSPHLNEDGPEHLVTIKLFGTLDDRIDGPLVDYVSDAVLRYWEPVSLAWASLDIKDIEPRYFWEIPPGYRLWLRDDVGPITHVAEGVVVETAPQRDDAAHPGRLDSTASRRRRDGHAAAERTRRDPPMSMPRTVGQLRAELSLYPDDATVDVFVRQLDGSDLVMPVVNAGYGPGVLPDQVFGSNLPLLAAETVELDPQAR